MDIMTPSPTPSPKVEGALMTPLHLRGGAGGGAKR
jgi:hypothetical protein